MCVPLRGWRCPRREAGAGVRARFYLFLFLFCVSAIKVVLLQHAHVTHDVPTYNKQPLPNVYNTASMTTSVPVSSTRENNGTASTECIEQARHHRRRPRHTGYFLSNLCREPLTFSLITLLPIALGILDPPPPPATAGGLKLENRWWKYFLYGDETCIRWGLRHPSKIRWTQHAMKTESEAAATGAEWAREAPASGMGERGPRL